MILLLDNYDSFTWNLYHYIQELTDEEVKVVRNDQITIQELDQFDSFILSPGPGLPSDAGIMPELLHRCINTKPILGVCLGMQAIAEYLGYRLRNLNEVKHGIQKQITVLKKSDPLFKNLPETFIGGSYHSWVIDSISDGELEIIARDNQNEIMAVSHFYLPVKGVQFHPESIMTTEGKTLLSNWLNFVKKLS